jgi:dTDP-4-amino-4,6-dideoxygalactose transaminase
MYGNPCEIDELIDFCEDKDLMLLFDAAHALGSKYKNTPVASQGDAHSFSCSPTKLFCTIEGGILTTNNEKIAEKVRRGRNYGNFPNYTCDLPGMSARMYEIHAAVGLATIHDIPTFVSNRNQYVGLYRERLNSISGIKFQKITDGCVSTYKDFSILIDPEKFGMNRNLLATALNAENIQTKFYFYPPIHQLEAYNTDDQPVLPITTQISYNVLSLPIHNFMKEDDIKRITNCIETIHEHSETIRKKR